MKKRLFLLSFAVLMALQAGAQQLSVTTARFRQGDDMSWAKPAMDDSSWSEVDITKQWDKQGFPQNTNACGWYRIHVTIPKSVLQGSDQQNALILHLPKADDVDECYLNGKLIGSTGRMPTNPAGYFPASSAERKYVVDVRNDGVRLDGDNVIAVRVYNRGGSGGLYNNPLTITCPRAADGLSMSLAETNASSAIQTFNVSSFQPFNLNIEVTNAYLNTTTGTLDIAITDRETGATVKSLTKKLSLKRNKPVRLTVPYTMDKPYQLTATYTDAKTGKVLSQSRQLKYALTPAAPATPRFNGAPVWGVRPGSPVIYRFPVSGEKPMKFTCSNLPEGLQLTEDGILSGKIDTTTDLTFTVTAENAKGKASQEFTLKVGPDKIGQTPPMGWNSWNCWGLTVTQEKVMASTQALIDKGLADYGYSYINIDDGWEAGERNPDGTLDANEKFPSMKGLADWLHERGLKFGIYSAPGATTCGGYLGSLDYEKEDAEVWNRWGVDYLKYDWCSYEQVRVRENDWGYASCVRPYLLMQKYLRQQPRDIFYSLGPLGGTQVYLWGLYCDGNSWRTAQDINDTWKSISDVGFRQQAGKSQYSSIGHWNDPDMLVVGKVGYGLGEDTQGLRETRLTPDEQYTHITLWSLVSSNMLIGCDIAQMDDFTLNLLCNNEVNAINQDLLGKQADRVAKEGDIEVWSRPLSDGAIAVGLFNVGETDQQVDMEALIPSTEPARTIRDVWRQKDLKPSELKCTIPLHGCRLLKVFPAGS